MQIRKKNSPSPTLIMGLVLVLAGGVAFFWKKTPSTNPADALARSIRLMDSADPKAVDTLLKVAAKDAALSPWVKLYQAKLAEKAETQLSPQSLYRDVPESSAASLDARVSLARLNFDSPGSKPIDQELETLRELLTRAKRTDLVAELEFLRASQSDVEPLLKLEDLLSFREKYPRSIAVKAARELYLSILASSPELRATLPREHLERALQTLLNEKELQLALAEVQAVKETTEPKSANFFRSLLLEESVLRALRRHEDADHLLSIISADGPLGSGDVAMLKLAKNSWNTDDYDGALNFLDSLSQRFPLTELKLDADYTRGRILEEMSQLPDAKEVYLNLQSGEAPTDLKIKALHRVAWLYLRSGSAISAADHFLQLRELAKTELALLSQEFAKNRRAILDSADEYFHAWFWEAYALSILSPAEQASVSPKHAAPESLRRELAQAQPFGYYGIRARTALTVNQLAPALFGELETAACSAPVNSDLSSRLKTLSDVGLTQLAQYEVDWFLSSVPEEEIPTQWQKTFTRAQLYHQYGSPKEAIGLADGFIRERLPLALLGKLNESEARCLTGAVSLSYPLPYLEQFKRSAKHGSIPTELLLAIARTESHFDPLAESKAGAKGLAQLLPTTAKAEGLLPEQDLFNVSVNLDLSASHLRRLLNQTGESIEYAVAAYNGGSSAVNRWRTRYPELDPILWTEMIGYPETRDYVKKVTVAQEIYQQLLKSEKPKQINE